MAAQFAEFAEAGFTDIIVRNMASDQSDALATIEALSDVREQLVIEEERRARRHVEEMYAQANDR